MADRQSPHKLDPIALFSGGGELGERTREFDWSQTPVGPIAEWPQSLRTIVRTMLDSRYAMWLGWGSEFTFFYNDAYAQMTLGAKHPWALGRSAREVWSEIWADIGPRAESVVTTGRATWDEGLLLFLERNGFPEETYHTFSYSPVPNDAGGIGGLLCVVTEDTERTIGERRLRTLRELAARTTDEARSVHEACQTAARLLAANNRDVPFVMLYLLQAGADRATLCGVAGIDAGHPARPETIDLSAADPPWPLRAVAESGQAVVVEALSTAFGPLPGGAWPEPAQQAVVLPMAKPGQSQLAGFVVAGVSPRRPLDDNYRGFFDLLAGQVATAVANARAYEDERRRAEALAKLDRAKTTFFSNISHEFRTPLTLMLGPAEDALADAESTLSDAQRERVELIHRNGLRLQRLVNTLLDFSRIEAGRMQARFEPTDLAAFTTELASNFRSACERADLSLTVDCGPLEQPAYVDHAMWEKIVLNLLSNAFKFTFAGGIEVSLRQRDHTVELQVRDTGIGIAQGQLPKLFERFHRVEGAQGRTHEGSGIGLALVQELVKLHGGEIAVASEPGRGTTFTVSIPLGKAHLPADQVSSVVHSTASAAATAFVEEALRWLPGRNVTEASISDQEAESAVGRPRILVADDNADMRDYVLRLLSPQYQVQMVADGEAALRSVAEQTPDLILSDVMMPRLDGFGLLRRLRDQATTAAIPVVLLSARAGEESRAEGLQAGADDYLVKPFSAQDLLVRVATLLSITQLRREARDALRQSDERFRLFMNNSPTTAFIKDAAGLYLYVNETVERDFGRPLGDWVGHTDYDIFTPTEAEQIRQNDLGVLNAGEPGEFEEVIIKPDGLHYYLSFKFPITQPDGTQLLGGMSIDITDRKRAEARFQQLADAMPQIVWTARADGQIDYLNRRWTEFTGLPADVGNAGWSELLHPDDAAEANRRWADSVRQGTPFEMGIRLLDRRQSAYRWHLIRTVGVKDDAGNVVRWFGTSTEIHSQKRAEESSRYLAEVSAVLSRVVDSESTLQTVANLAVPHFADWSAVDVADSNGNLRRLAVAHKDQTKIDLVQRLMREYPEDPKSPTGAYAVQRTGEPAFVPDITDDMLVAGARNEQHLDLIRSLGLKSYICVPLKVSGQPMGVLTFATAESGRRYDESDLALALDLAQRAAVAIENTQLYEALREADRRKDEFLATLAHELRNPLAPIRNGLQVLKLAESDAATREEVRTMMERQLGQMVRLIDDLLDLSRISRGKIELRKERVKLAKVVQTAVETSRPAIEAGGHALSVHLPPEPLVVDADVTRLAQVISNLLNNAAKYTERGGQIALTVTGSSSEVSVSVRDNGIGIPASMLPHVFDMFTQVDRNLERSQSGLGIGLSIVKRLVEMHGGSVEARSAGPGHGSEFVVRLPLATAEPIAADTHSDLRRSASQRKVLVVDDNRDAAISLAMMLKLMGNDTKTAHDGLEAIDVAAAFQPDLILLDIGMPRLNGYDTARQIRETPWGRGVLLVALTGWGQDDDRRKSKEAGFDHHLTKPVDPTRLEKLLYENQASRLR
jgi:PAS domain S-box-containing protein